MSNVLKAKIIEKYGNFVNLAKDINMPLTSLLYIIENGVNNTKATNLKKICDALQIDMYAVLEDKIKDYVPDTFKLTVKEKQLIEAYRQLDMFGVDVVDSVLHLEKERNIFYENKNNFSWLPFIDTRASAGTGQELLEGCEFVKIPRSDMSDVADCVIQVQGDSMEPDYCDGDYVLVKTTLDLSVGDVGIFLFNNEAFIKEMGKGCLLSRNPRYKPIYIEENDVCYIRGRVLDKTEVVE